MVISSLLIIVLTLSLSNVRALISFLVNPNLIKAATCCFLFNPNRLSFLESFSFLMLFGFNIA